jgi:hypothetical protein
MMLMMGQAQATVMMVMRPIAVTVRVTSLEMYRAPPSCALAALMICGTRTALNTPPATRT